MHRPARVVGDPVCSYNVSLSGFPLSCCLQFLQSFPQTSLLQETLLTAARGEVGTSPLSRTTQVLSGVRTTVDGLGWSLNKSCTQAGHMLAIAICLQIKLAALVRHYNFDRQQHRGWRDKQTVLASLVNLWPRHHADWGSCPVSWTAKAEQSEQIQALQYAPKCRFCQRLVISSTSRLSLNFSVSVSVSLPRSLFIKNEVE